MMRVMSSPTPPGMPPQYPPPPAAAPKGKGPLFWILIGVGVLMLMVVGAVTIGGFFVYRAAKSAGFDSTLLKNNPGLAIAKMAVAANPDLETVSTNDSAGTITVRDKTNGDVLTLRFDTEKKTLVATDKDGKEVRFNVSGDEFVSTARAEVISMTEQELTTRLVSLPDRKAQQERLVNELIAYMIDLDMDRFERVLDGFILAGGIDKAITQIVLPFLQRIGILWMADHIDPAQEHLAANIIRQKLSVGIDGAMTHRRTDKTVVLFLPEGQHRELGLLYVCYLLKIQGVRALYLGEDLPLKDIEFVCQRKAPDYLYTHLTGSGGDFNFEKFLLQVTQRFSTPLVISGQLARARLRKVPGNVQFRRSIPEVLEFVATL